jgi:hypothetical protein
MPEPEATANQFKVGSKLSELERQLGNWSPSSVYVYEWTESSSTKSRSIDDIVVEDNGGQYLQTYVGTLADWDASASERDRFTGRVNMSHHSWVIPDDLAPSFTIELTYIDGVLRKVDYGILPG